MTGNIAIIGNGDFITVFQAAGVKAFSADSEQKAKEALRQAALNFQIIFMTEELYRPLAEYCKRFDEAPYPIVIPIPSGKGEGGDGQEILKKSMERALGVDILFEK